MSKKPLPRGPVMFPLDPHTRYERAVKLHQSVHAIDTSRKTVDIVQLRTFTDKLESLLQACVESEQYKSASKKLQNSAQDAKQQIDIARENLERKAIIPVIAALVRATDTAREITAFFEFENEEKAKGISEDGARRTRRTPGEPTKPKNVYFPQSMLEDLRAVAGQRGDSVNKLIVDMCGEGLRQGAGPAPIMITLPASVSPDLRERIEDMASSFSRVIAQMVADSTPEPDDGFEP